jgi:hypothetical protein
MQHTTFQMMLNTYESEITQHTYSSTLKMEGKLVPTQPKTPQKTNK